MTTTVMDMSPRQAAVVAGAGYLVIFVLAIFAEFFVRATLVVPDDAAATVANLLSSSGQFRAGIVGYLVAAVFDVVVALALYVFFAPVSRSLALLAAWMRLVHALVFALAVGNLLSAARLAGGADVLAAMDAGTRQAQVMLSLEAFNNEWLIGLLFFGVHCLLLGWLILRSGQVPRLIGFLLMIAGVSYVADTLANFVLPNYNNYAAIFLLIVAVPAIIAEMSLCPWLLIRGGQPRPAAA